MDASQIVQVQGGERRRYWRYCLFLNAEPKAIWPQDRRKLLLQGSNTPPFGAQRPSQVVGCSYLLSYKEAVLNCLYCGGCAPFLSCKATNVPLLEVMAPSANAAG
jgi:hypothetical protein